MDDADEDALGPEDGDDEDDDDLGYADLQKSRIIYVLVADFVRMYWDFVAHLMHKTWTLNPWNPDYMT